MQLRTDAEARPPPFSLTYSELSDKNICPLEHWSKATHDEYTLHRDKSIVFESLDAGPPGTAPGAVI
jgi:hypothetical protein